MAERIEAPGIRGWLHRPASKPSAAIAITHGAGSNCEAALLVAVAEEFAKLGWLVLRYDLSFRQARPKGSPVHSAAKDQEGIRLVSEWLRPQTKGPLYLSGHSYGGRMTSILAAQDSSVADALLLLSYPLHPPKQPEKSRTEHFPSLRVPTFFAHGMRDEFGSIEEIEAARQLIPACTTVWTADKAPHGLAAKFAPAIADGFATFTKSDA
jgi:predicted alpha/beta-hydrolase family hydrolase